MKTTKLNTTQLRDRYPKFAKDREYYSPILYCEAIEYRLKHQVPSMKCIISDDLIFQYMPYIAQDDILDVRTSIAAWFKNAKLRHHAFAKYRSMPELKRTIFKDKDQQTYQSLDSIFIQGELPSVDTVVVKTKNTPYAVGEIIVKYGDRMYKSKCSSDEELNRYIDVSKEYL